MRAVVLTGADPETSRPDELDGLQQAREVEAALVRLGYEAETRHVTLDLRVLERLRADTLAVNLVEALRGDGRLIHLVPAVLEAAGVPFTGASARALWLTTDKIVTKELLRAAGLPTPVWSRDGAGLAGASPVIVKSVCEDASFGLDAGSVVAAAEAAALIAMKRHRHGGDWFAETFVDGRELNLSILEIGGAPRVLPVAEIDFSAFDAKRPKIVGYGAKWVADSLDYVQTQRRFVDPAGGDKSLLETLRALALAAWDILGLSGYGRVDFRVDATGAPFILEVNANPCLSSDAGFMAAASRDGLTLDAVMRQLVDGALEARSSAA